MRFENNQKFIKLKTSRRFLHLRRGSTLWLLAYFHLLLKHELDFRQTVSGSEARGVRPDGVPSPPSSRPGFGSPEPSPRQSLLPFCHISVLLCGLDCFLHPTFLLTSSPLPPSTLPPSSTSSSFLCSLPGPGGASWGLWWEPWGQPTAALLPTGSWLSLQTTPGRSCFAAARGV